jgi:hypothetical protein
MPNSSLFTKVFSLGVAERHSFWTDRLKLDDHNDHEVGQVIGLALGKLDGAT